MSSLALSLPLCICIAIVKLICRFAPRCSSRSSSRSSKRRADTCCRRPFLPLFWISACLQACWLSSCTTIGSLPTLQKWEHISQFTFLSYAAKIYHLFSTLSPSFQQYRIERPPLLQVTSVGLRRCRAIQTIDGNTLFSCSHGSIS